LLPLVLCARFQLYDSKDLLTSKIALASKTKMMDFWAGEYKTLHGKDPENLEADKAAVYKELQDSQAACGPLLNVLNDENQLAETLKADNNFTAEHLETEYKVTRDNIDALYVFAKLNFDCGRYRDSADYLHYYRLLSRNTPEDIEKNFQALWGKLASEILMVNGDAAYADLVALKESIDQRIHVAPYLQLQQRAWLVTWSLFVFFNIPDGRVKMIEFMMGDAKLLNAIQTSCPHLLRYLTTAVIINRKSLRTTSYSKNVLKDLSRILLTERDSYTDPLIGFLLAVYQEFDFNKAHVYLKQSEVLLQNDFFLGYSTEEFMENARLLLFEAYTKIHKIIEIGSVAGHCVFCSPCFLPLFALGLMITPRQVLTSPCRRSSS
jgi:translation initiation factor 3 subunit E